MGLTDNSVYWHYSSNSWNRNTHHFKNNSQEITLQLYIQYFRLIAMSTLCLVLLSTDTGLKHSTSQICSHTRSTLCFLSQVPFTLSHPLSSLCCKQHSDSPWHDRTPSYCLLPLYVAHFHSQTFFAIPVSPWHTILISSSSLDVRCYMRHYNTRCRCPLVQYLPVGYATLTPCF